ncbi:MAG: hypothetical protein KDC38_16840 [Planctomycetes bacterium]|nr:hypothetical protein [Planctomycetota bacterium]
MIADLLGSHEDRTDVRSDADLEIQSIDVGDIGQIVAAIRQVAFGQQGAPRTRCEHDEQARCHRESRHHTLASDTPFRRQSAQPSFHAGDPHAGRLTTTLQSSPKA